MNIGNIIKQHRYESICLVLSLLLLLALWPAARVGSQAKARAQENQKLNENLANLQRPGKYGVANAALVEARQEFARQMETEAEKVAGIFRQKNERQLLIEGMFPKADAAARWSFRDECKKKIDAIYEQILKAGWPGDQPEISEKKNLAAIGIYVNREEEEGLSVGEWLGASDLPGTDDCWFGQLALWIQQDLAEIFSDLNLASAQVRAQKPSVTNAVVKRIISIDVDPYYYVGDLKQGQPPGTPGIPGLPAAPGARPPGRPAGPAFPGFFPGMQPGLGTETRRRTTTGKERRLKRLMKDQPEPFTGRISGENADVLHFSFSVVVDSRCINELLADLGRKNLYTILAVSLSREDVPIDTGEFRKFSDKSENFNPHQEVAGELVYGTDPIVRLDVDAEALFLKNIYGQYMPEEIRKSLEDDKSQFERQVAAAKKQREDASKAKAKADSKKDRTKRGTNR